jgi:Xaa-Pro aminopeptidase
MDLPPMDVSARLGRLRATFDEARCDALLVTNLTNVRYLCGFTGSAGTLLVRSGDAVLFTDGRRSYVDSFGSGVELVPTEGVVETLRRVKDAGELARIEAACGIADVALASVLKSLLELPTEREFGLELDFAMRRMGASDVSFETIVASGPNGAKPHARPSERRISPGELVVLDFGALVDGYHSDMTRTVCVGDPATSRLVEIDAVVRGAQAAGVAAVRAGVGAREVDDVCRSFIADAGFGDRFVHGTGHGVGLDIHEFPILGQTATASLDAGFVVTVEPGVYLPEEGGVRIEDSVVVTADGCRPLTHAPKDLVIA